MSQNRDMGVLMTEIQRAVFFENSRVSASITGIDQNLIDKFHVILQVISCGFDINVVKFEEYALSTARRFVESMVLHAD